MNLSFKIKICGVTRVGDAEAAVDAGADAIGLNFFCGSKRFVTGENAARIAAAIPSDVAKIGVFVNPTREEVLEVLHQVRLDALQFHGDEPAEFIAKLSSIPVLRAFRWRDGGKDIDQYLAHGLELKFAPAYLLVDSHMTDTYGGSGTTSDWEAIAAWRRERCETSVAGLPPLVLAGGLTPSNVSEAIRATKPGAVDTASGVESSPGHKDTRLMREFVDAARRAFAEAK